MRRQLFLTGPIGCGKSTILLNALGPNLCHAGGFLTVRRRFADGTPADFVLMSPDGTHKEVFLDLTKQEPRLDPDVFSGLGTALLHQAKDAPFVILDEIGGIELLCPEFMTALDSLLEHKVPILGVLKGEGPASALIRRLGLDRELEESSARLRSRLQNDPDTLVYECVQYSKAALRLTKDWVKEYCP